MVLNTSEKIFHYCYLVYKLSLYEDILAKEHDKKIFSEEFSTRYNR